MQEIEIIPVSKLYYICSTCEMHFRNLLCSYNAKIEIIHDIKGQIKNKRI